LLLNEFLFLSSEIRSLLSYDKSEQLILKTSLSDSEVDESGLGLDFRRIVRVREFGVQEQVELGIKS